MRRLSVGMSLGSVLVGSLLVVACSGDGETDRPDDEETGGTSGTGATGGSTPTGGASGAGVTGGSSPGGAGAGGAGGSGGSNTCKACEVTECGTQSPPTDVINDFENLLIDPLTPTFGIYNANDDMGMPKPEWWLGYFSGSFAYPGIPDACTGEPTPMYPLTRTDASGEMHVTGTVGTYSGFGIWMGQCKIDMSSATGVSFRIGGTAGSGMLKFSINTNSNLEPVMCTTGKGTCNIASAGACTPASVLIAIPATPEVVTVAFADLTGGSPVMTVDPAEVIQLQWDFDWADTMTPYEVDVTLDDVMMVQ
jgi:hypothetical protein